MAEDLFSPLVFTAGAELCTPFVERFGITGASISVFGRAKRQSTIGATDLTAARVEALQFHLGEGPHWEALATRGPVLCPDLGNVSSSHWPMLLDAVHDLGVAALFAFPMTMGAAIVGVVDMYADSPHSFDAESVSRASVMAGHAAAPAVRYAMHSAANHDSEESALAPAMRREVHQATGMVLSQLDISATDAFARMQAYAFSTGQSMDQVARDIIDRTLAFDALPE
jgi:hypothetical protein